MNREFELILTADETLKTSTRAAQLFGLTVGATLGPGGRTQIIRDGQSTAPLVTKDGATVARKLASGDPEVDLMLKLFREAALNVEKRVGDGTTTTSILTADMISLMDNYIRKHDLLPVHALRSLNAEIEKFQTYLRENATKVVTRDDMYRVAYISTNSDDSIAKHVADAISQIGHLGIFRVRDGMDQDRVHVTQGYPTTMSVLGDHYLYGDAESLVIKDALVIINNAPCDDVIIKVCQHAVDGQRDCVLICDDYENHQDDLFAIYRKAYKSNVRFVVLKTSSYGKDRVGCNSDVAFITEAVKDDKLTTLRIGVAPSVTVSKVKATFGFDIDVTPQVEAIEKLQKEATTNYDIERFQLRIARLRGGIAEIQVTGNTPADQVERVQRYDDALRATQSAIRGGSVIGGGFSYLDYLKEIQAEESPILTEVMIPLMKTVFKRTLTNAGVSEEVVEQKISMYLNDGTVYDVATGDEMSKDKFMVIDPADTSFYAMETAFTLTKLTLNTSNILMGDPNLFTHAM